MERRLFVCSRSICSNRQATQAKMTQEQLVIITCIPVARTSRNSQFFSTEDLGSGVVFLSLLPICKAFLPLRVSVSKNQTKSEISGKNVKIQICSNSGY